MTKKVIVAMSGGVDSAISAYILKKRGGYEIEAAFMNNWDARDEGTSSKNCTIGDDLNSIERTCKVLGISKLHQVNYQSSYWQRVFTLVLSGYNSGTVTPNPDILCNREIKFGDLFKWTMERADILSTGHYARIRGGKLVQAVDLSKDQTYFLAAINRNCLASIMFPVGELMKSEVKSVILKEASLDHLIDRKESMGLCFVGKRRKFREFLSEFSPDPVPGPIINLDTGILYSNQLHRGLSAYTRGQKVSLGGVKNKLYVASKDSERNVLFVVDRLDHSSLWSNTLNIGKCEDFSNSFFLYSNIFCSIRSIDKIGVKVKSVVETSQGFTIELSDRVFAPCQGQWAVFYAENLECDSTDTGLICLGGSEII